MRPLVGWRNLALPKPGVRVLTHRLTQGVKRVGTPALRTEDQRKSPERTGRPGLGKQNYTLAKAET